MFHTILSILTIKKNGVTSYTTTAFVLGTIIINFKLLFSGISFNEFKMQLFSGSDYAQAMASLAALYVSNKHITNIQINKSKSGDTP